MNKMAAAVLAFTFAVVGVAAAAEMEGTIRSIDTGAKEVALDNGSTLVVDDSTAITIEGKTANLDDLKEGAKVKASYQEKDGKNVVATIEVMQ